MGTSVNTGTQNYADAYFNSKYVLGTLSDVYELKNLLCNPTFIDQLNFFFTNPSDFVNSIKYYPFNISSFCGLSGTYIKLGDKTTSVSGARITSIAKRLQIASFFVSRNKNNFMDFEPYTKIEMYIPYFGFYNLPVNEVMGKTVYVYLSVDFDTGIATIYIATSSAVIMTATSKLGIDIPLGASNMKEVVKDNIENALKLTAGIVTMAVAPAGKVTGALLTAKGLGMAVTSGIDAVFGSEVRYTRGTMTGGMDMLASPTSIYLIITYPNAVDVDSSYTRLKGKPCGEIRSLIGLTGFTTVEQMHLEGFSNALNSELQEIESLLHEGVIL